MVWTQHNIVPSFYILIFGQAKRVALNDLFRQSLSDPGGDLEGGEYRGRGRVLYLGGEHICMSARCSNRVCSKSELG